MRALIIAAAVLFCAAGCRSHKAAESASGEFAAARRVEALRRDSLIAASHFELDSPQITVEWLDAPRRRITVTARRACRKASVTEVAEERLAASDSAVAAVSRHTESESVPQPAGCPWWLRAGLAVAAAGAIALSFAKIRARR